jgi:hypothetical protein
VAFCSAFSNAASRSLTISSDLGVRAASAVGDFFTKGQDQMDKPFTEQELSKVLANPFYCLWSVHPIFAQDHDTLV